MSAAKTIRVVMAEDSPADAELAAYALKRHGIAAVVVVATTEQEFREALVAAPTDVVISDFSMQVMDGGMAYEIARELVPNAPFVFLSGSIFYRANEFEPMKAAAVLDKKDMDKLGAVVDRLLHRPAGP